MVGEIEPEALRERLDGEGAPLVVDIRAPEAYAEGHLPESENVPMAELPREIDAIAGADHVVTVCPEGLASVKAARIVEAYREFDGRVESLAGGLEAWDGPLESDDTDAAESAPF